jgi:uncharacterized protein YbaR (Trm112 family)
MEIRCPHCTATLDVEDFSAGRLTICPACSGTFRIEPTSAATTGPLADMPSPGGSPGAPEVAGTATPPWGSPRPAEPLLRRDPGDRLIRCPACERQLSVGRSMAGQTMICPTCRNRLQIPIHTPASDPALDPSGPQAVVLQPDPPRPYVSVSPIQQPTALAEPPSAAWQPEPWDGRLETNLPAIREQRANNPYRLPAIFLMIVSGFGLTTMLPMIGSQLLATLFGQTSGLFTLGAYLVAGIAHGLTFYGGLQMHSRTSLKMAKLGAWAGLYPISFCCFLPAPFAIWALIRLSDPKAESDFDEP